MDLKFPDVQFILNVLARSLLVLTSQGDLLLEDDHFESFKTGKWALVGPSDSVLPRTHQAETVRFLRLSFASRVKLGV